MMNLLVIGRAFSLAKAIQHISTLLIHTFLTTAPTILIGIGIFLIGFVFFVFMKRKPIRFVQMLRNYGDWHIYPGIKKKNREDPKEEDSRKKRLTEKKYNEIAEKLQDFEKRKLFKTRRMTVITVAKILGTNEAYLSRYINDTKNIKFPRYIDELRIAEIVKMMEENPKILHFSTSALAEEVGYCTRQKFAKAFFEIMGVYPSQFITEKLNIPQTKTSSSIH